MTTTSNQPTGAGGGENDLIELVAAALWEHDEDHRSDDPVPWADWLAYVNGRPVRTLVAEIEKYRGRGRAVVAALASTARAGAGDWQPITTAPADGRTIIAYGGRFDEPTPTQADGAWWNSTAGRSLRGSPTHWMPLPAAPGQSPAVPASPPVSDPVAEACQPWRFGAGDPPSDDSPLIGPYSAGIGYAIRHLADLTEAGDYVSADGSETFENDVRGTILNVLKAANIYDDEEGHLASLSHGITENGAEAQGFVVANACDGERQRFRAWGQFGPMWTANRTEALHFARRIDAERFCAEDEDAWRILLSAVPASPISTGSSGGFKLAVTDEWMRRKVAEEPDLETEAGILHPEASAPTEHGVEIRERVAAYLTALDAQPEQDCWDTESGEEEPGAQRFASDWAWADHHDRVAKALAELRAVAALSPHQGPETGGQGAGREGEGRDPDGSDYSAEPEPHPRLGPSGEYSSRDNLALMADLIEAGRRCADATFCLGMAQAHARPERVHQGDITKEEFAEAEKELARAQEEEDEAQLALISVYANADGYPMTREELVARLAPGDRSPAGAETHSGSVGDESAVPGAAGQAPCHWGGGNDIIWCSTCGAEYAYAKGEERPACPRSVPSPTDAKTGEV